MSRTSCLSAVETSAFADALARPLRGLPAMAPIIARVVSVSADSGDAWDLSATYTMGDIAITATDDEEDGGAAISAAYTSGALSVGVNSDSEVTVGYDMGNADLAVVRDDDGTTVKYTVAF